MSFTLAARRCAAGVAVGGGAGLWLSQQSVAISHAEQQQQGSGGGWAFALPVPRVAFLGNSYFYYNDTPRLLQELHGGEGAMVTADCLRGGASFVSLLVEGDGMDRPAVAAGSLLPWNGKPSIAALLKDPYDFVVCNDYSQNNARGEKKAETRAALDTIVAMAKAGGSQTIVLMPTAAYRAPANRSETIGSWADFYYKQGAGHREHLRYLLAAGVDAKIADANEAFKVSFFQQDGHALCAVPYVPCASPPRPACSPVCHLPDFLIWFFAIRLPAKVVHEEDPALWAKLFHVDNYHPTVFGSFLQACVIHATIFGEPPAESALPSDPKQLWARARRLLPKKEQPPEWPTRGELLYLREVAARVAASSYDCSPHPHARI